MSCATPNIDAEGEPLIWSCRRWVRSSQGAGETTQNRSATTMARTIPLVALYGVGRVFADCLVSMREITAIDCQPLRHDWIFDAGVRY